MPVQKKPVVRKAAPSAPKRSAGGSSAGAGEKPACVREIEQFAASSVDDAWRKLEGRVRLSDADMNLWIEAMRADRARWILKERRKEK